MEALLFEVVPRSGHEEQYFQHAARLKPLVMKNEGLLFLDRFKSHKREGLILSHSHWRDEAAISSWRADCTHYKSQEAGRNKHFADYRLRIGHVVKHVTPADTTLSENRQAAYLHPAHRAPRHVVIIASTGHAFDGGGHGEVFESVYNEAAFLFITDAATDEEANELLDDARQKPETTSIIHSITSRDYGMFERAEAPQYFPEAVL